ncbi:hypothetical protein H310_07293 [Aphanomyces invadans]|uniref:Pirin n=1 Tax=Aphanomyces invadans TaxID=157072 RepID=A0A024U4C2_9STRA|nr:hypothetical protein H310_07293 [Aphanomyces invadans]ETW00747.1 hypothetical protein H310_07293 [Aphanomyces invadans]|eukprot:XP_008870882.1 hypothetical protein H310_07293 [Aphanomyces invadans]
MALACPGPLRFLSAMTTHAPMPLIRIANAGKVHPFGDERTVHQAFPAGIPSDESDPFLMCDNFAFESEGISSDKDDFPIGWHPHRGMDILTYIKTGVGRHGDSMGNRETFSTPGMQWISCGSGIEHAEGGATPVGEVEKGFQIWLNVPAAKKMDDPAYGTEPTSSIPTVELADGVQARLLAGPFLDGRTGAFKAVQPVQMVDFELEPGSKQSYSIPSGFDTCMLYVYEGSGRVGNKATGPNQIALFDATSDNTRGFELSAGSTKVAAMLFTGKKLNEPLAWHGPIVMNTRRQIQDTFDELRQGKFPPKRVPWDYKDLSAFPKDKVPKA